MEMLSEFIGEVTQKVLGRCPKYKVTPHRQCLRSLGTRSEDEIRKCEWWFWLEHVSAYIRILPLAQCAWPSLDVNKPFNSSQLNYIGSNETALFHISFLYYEIYIFWKDKNKRCILLGKSIGPVLEWHCEICDSRAIDHNGKHIKWIRGTKIQKETMVTQKYTHVGPFWQTKRRYCVNQTGVGVTSWNLRLCGRSITMANTERWSWKNLEAEVSLVVTSVTN